MIFDLSKMSSGELNLVYSFLDKKIFVGLI